MVFCQHNDDKPCRWRRRKEARPEEILEAALELFTEKGFAATRITDVARKAGISKGTLYLYFDNKEAIFRAVVQEMITPQLEREEALVDAYQGPTDVLFREMIHDWWEYIGNSKLSAIPKLMIAEAGNFPELAEFFVRRIQPGGSGSGGPAGGGAHGATGDLETFAAGFRQSHGRAGIPGFTYSLHPEQPGENTRGHVRGSWR